MSLFLLTRPGTDGGEDGRQPFATSWLDAGMRLLEERLAEVAQGDPVIDFIPMGDDPPEGAIAWAMVTRLDVRPRLRNPNDGPCDTADVQLAVTCMAGQALMRTDPNAAMRIAGRVWLLLDEYERTETVSVGPGDARDITLYLQRARIEDADAGGQRAVRLPSVVVDAGLIETDRAG